MTAYIDTSALLRLVLREAGALAELRSFDELVSSELIACLGHWLFPVRMVGVVFPRLPLDDRDRYAPPPVGGRG